MTEKKKILTVAERNAADPDQNMINALLEERRGVDQQGKKDRVKAIDAELDRLGYKPEKRSRASRAGAAERIAADHLNAGDNPQVDAGDGPPASDVDAAEAARLAAAEEHAADERKAAGQVRGADAAERGKTRATAKPRSRRGRGGAQVTG